MKIPNLVLCLSVLSTAAACGGSSTTPVPETAKADENPAADPTEPMGGGEDIDLIALGGELYAANCAECHGASGQGSDQAPPVVGPDALPREPRPGQNRDAAFVTALDVFEWVKSNMPPGDPGAFEDDQYLAVMAFALDANGVDLPGGTLDGASAAEIVLHP